MITGLCTDNAENKLVKLIAEGKITVEELSQAERIIQMAELVKAAMDAIPKTVKIPLGADKVDCYQYWSSDYEAYGIAHNDGTFECRSNWGGDHEEGRCNLLDSKEILLALVETNSFSSNLERFLKECIKNENKR